MRRLVALMGLAGSAMTGPRLLTASFGPMPATRVRLNAASLLRPRVQARQLHRSPSVHLHAKATGRYLNTNDSVEGVCEMCGIDQRLTIHHLIPRVQLKRMRRRGRFSGKQEPPTAVLCSTCHNMVHRTFTHSQLGRSYSSIEELVEAEELQTYLETRRAWQRTGSRRNRFHLDPAS